MTQTIKDKIESAFVDLARGMAAHHDEWKKQIKNAGDLLGEWAALALVEKIKEQNLPFVTSKKTAHQLNHEWLEKQRRRPR